MRRIAFLLALLCLALPAVSRAGQNGGTAPATSMEFKDLVGGDSVPLSLKLKDLNGEWRRMSVGSTTDLSGGIMQMVMSLLGGGNSGVFYTKGQTVVMGGETYLIAYRARSKPIDFAALMKDNVKPPEPEKLTEETSLALSMLNLRTTGSLNDIRSFDLKTELADAESQPGGLLNALLPTFGQARAKAQDTSSLSNLKQIGTGILMYTQDYDEVLPPMKTEAKFKDVIMPYIKNSEVFINPKTRQPYKTNVVISGKPLASIAEPAGTILVYEDAPAEDGTRGVAFVDGHAKRIPEAEFQKLKVKQKIP